MPNFTLRVALLLLGSGFCSLVYQIAWLRLLRLVFGSSTAASAAVLAIFMGGLGLGSLLLGPRADRSRNPLGLYAGLEAGIAVAAGLSPLLVAAVRWLYLAVGGTEALGLAGGTGVRLALAALVLGLPVFLMGGTLPATVRAVTRTTDAGRRGLGLLYAANTLGAVAGTLVTTFYAVELLGTSKTVWVAALLNLLVAVAARALSRSAVVDGAAVGTPEGETALEAGEALPAAPGPASGRPPVPLVLAAAGVTGFAFFLMELVWYRMLAPILGGTSYTFGLILATALLGIGLGGLLYGAGSERVRPTLLGFAATCGIEAAALIAPFALGDRLAFLALELQGLGAAGFGGLVLGWSVVTGLVVLPAALVAGYQFPLLVALLGEGRRGVGREVGLAYAWNTAGAILGSIAGGFGLLPLLTAPGTWRAAAGVLVLLALAAAAVAGVRQDARPGATIAVIFLGLGSLVLAAAPGPSPFWRHSGIGAGRLSAELEDPNDLRGAIREHRADLVWEADGRESSVALIRAGGYAFIVNGKSDGSALADAGTQVMGGLVGSMLHPRPERALVIGLGTGSTAGWLADVPTMARVDAVELEPAILRVAEACTPVNRGVLEHPKVEVLLGDGREYLLTTGERYDVIFSEPSNPYRAGISSLYTREFYQAARERLTEDGLFLQWLQGYEVDASVVRTAYATLAAVFPAVESWQTLGGDLLLVASAEPLAHDLARVRRRAAAEPYRSALARAWGVAGAEGFYSGFLAGPDFGRAMAEAAGGAVNTDDHPVIEFGFVRNLGRSGLFSIEELARLARERGEHRPAFRGPAPDGWLVDDARLARGALFGTVPPPPAGADRPLEERARLRRAYVDNDWRAIRDGWAGQAPGPLQGVGHRVDLLAWGEALAEGGDPRAREVAERLRELSPAEADVVLALLESRQDNDQTAAWYLTEAFERLRADPWAQPGLVRSSFRLATALGRKDSGLAGELYDRLARPFAVAFLDQERRMTRLWMAASVDRKGVCVEAFADLEPWVGWDERTLLARVACYETEDHPLLAKARRDLAEWRSEEPPELEAGLAGAEE